jgi:basic membrane protein A
MMRLGRPFKQAASTSGYLLGSVVAVLFVSIFILTQMVAHTKTLKVVFLTDSAGLDDKGFNAVCWQGIEKAGKNFGLKAQLLQSGHQSDYVTNLTLAARHADVVVTRGDSFAEAVKEVAPHFPTTQFVHLEGDIPGDNVASYDFKSEEGGFLAGIVAGLSTTTGKTGMVCGIESATTDAYASGFKAGILTVEKLGKEPIEVEIEYAGSFNDARKGRTAAETLIGKGADVIFMIAGHSDSGVIEAARNSENVHLIAGDFDRDADLPGRILTSAVKRMDSALYEALEDIVQRNFQSGHCRLGASDEAVDITEMQYSKQFFDPKGLKIIQKVRTLLKDRKLSIPSRNDQLAEFQPPSL